MFQIMENFMLKQKYFSYVRFFSIICFLVDVPERQRVQPFPPLPKQLLDYIEDEEEQQEEHYSEEEDEEDPEDSDGSDTQYVADK